MLTDRQTDRYAMTTTSKDVSTTPAPASTRDLRQAEVQAWCVSAFGDHDALFIPQRGLRLFEEAIETAQACGCDSALLHRLIDHVYAKPLGELPQELGGLGVTMLALAAAAA